MFIKISKGLFIVAMYFELDPKKEVYKKIKWVDQINNYVFLTVCDER